MLLNKSSLIRRMLSVTSIAVAVFAFSGIFCATQIGDKLIKNEVDGLGLDMITVSPIEQLGSVSEEALNKMRSIEGVTDVYPIVASVCNSEIGGSCFESYLWGVGHNNSSMIKTETTAGREISKSDIAARRMVCVITTNMAEKYDNGIIGKNLSISIGGTDYEFQIVGTVEAASDLLNAFMGERIENVVLIPYTTYNMLTADNSVFSASIRVADSKADATVARLEEEFNNAYRISNLSAQKKSIDKIIDIVGVTLIGIAVISLMVAAIGIVSENWSAVNEGARDIGIKLSIGARSSDIIADVMKKSILMTIIGTVAGLLITVLAVEASLAAMNIDVTINYLFIVPVLLGAVVVGALCSILPAISAVRIPPIESIKG